MKKIIAILTASLMTAILLAGCAANTPAQSGASSSAPMSPSASNGEPSPAPAEKTDVTVAALIGPTGMGLVSLMDKQDRGEAENNYNFILSGTPDNIVAKITSGEADIAAVPVNLAPTLYNKTNGQVQLLAINTLGVLYVVENGENRELGWRSCWQNPVCFRSGRYA